MGSISKDNGDGISWDCCVDVYGWMSHLGIFDGMSISFSSYTDRLCHLLSLMVTYDMYVCTHVCVYM